MAFVIRLIRRRNTQDGKDVSSSRTAIREGKREDGLPDGQSKFEQSCEFDLGESGVKIGARRRKKGGRWMMVAFLKDGYESGSFFAASGRWYCWLGCFF